MKANIKGHWIDIDIYNTDLSTYSGEQRMDTIGLSITSYGRWGDKSTVSEAHLYPEDAQNLIKALEDVLSEAIESRKKYHKKNPLPPSSEISTLITDGGTEILQEFLDEKREELEKLFRSSQWFEVPRNTAGVAEIWGTLGDIYEEFMPFLVWNSSTSRPEFVDEGWKDNELYRKIAMDNSYTKFKGINI